VNQAEDDYDEERRRDPSDGIGARDLRRLAACFEDARVSLCQVSAASARAA
jgi:hypothetical protein